MAKTMKELRDFTKRVAGDTKVVINVQEMNIEEDILDIQLVRNKDGVKIVLVRD